MRWVRIGICLSLSLAFLAAAAWVVTRFVGPVFSVSYIGYHDVAVFALLFVIALSLAARVLETQGR
ncbi:MAG: hypothetical protein AB1898_13940 [Acidobacteriota bacterium]